jgi:hypothetical protein
MESSIPERSDAAAALQRPTCFGERNGRYFVQHPQFPDHPGILEERHRSARECAPCVHRLVCWDFRKLRAREA